MSTSKPRSSIIFQASGAGMPGDYALRLTTAYYVSPLGKRSDNVGVAHDVVVESKDEQLKTASNLLFKNVPSLQQK